MAADEINECPLCMEPMEYDDLGFFPCLCGYQICRFCWFKIINEENGLCPACRKPYNSEKPASFKPMTEEEFQRLKFEKKKKDQKKSKLTTENKKRLADLRVLQKNLVFVIGLPLRLAQEKELLKGPEYFGRCGRVFKIVVNQNQTFPSLQGQPCVSAYVTYYRPEDAIRAILELNKMEIDGRALKLSLGTTKYCSQFLRGAKCNKHECMYLHDLGDDAASFTKEQMQAGRHTDYENRLVQSYLDSNPGFTITVPPTSSATTNSCNSGGTNSRCHSISNKRPVISSSSSGTGAGGCTGMQYSQPQSATGPGARRKGSNSSRGVGGGSDNQLSTADDATSSTSSVICEVGAAVIADSSACGDQTSSVTTSSTESISGGDLQQPRSQHLVLPAVPCLELGVTAPHLPPNGMTLIHSQTNNSGAVENHFHSSTGTSAGITSSNFATPGQPQPPPGLVTVPNLLLSLTSCPIASPRRETEVADIDFDPFSESQRGLAELMASEQLFRQQSPSRNSTGVGGATGEQFPHPHVPLRAPPGFEVSSPSPLLSTAASQAHHSHQLPQSYQQAGLPNSYIAQQLATAFLMQNPFYLTHQQQQHQHRILPSPQQQNALTSRLVGQNDQLNPSNSAGVTSTTCSDGEELQNMLPHVKISYGSGSGLNNTPSNKLHSPHHHQQLINVNNPNHLANPNSTALPTAANHLINNRRVVVGPNSVSSNCVGGQQPMGTSLSNVSPWGMLEDPAIVLLGQLSSSPRPNGSLQDDLWPYSHHQHHVRSQATPVTSAAVGYEYRQNFWNEQHQTLGPNSNSNSVLFQQRVPSAATMNGPTASTANSTNIQQQH